MITVALSRFFACLAHVLVVVIVMYAYLFLDAMFMLC